MTTVNLRNGMVVTEASMADDGHEIYFLPVAEECILSAADAVAAAASAQTSLNSLVSASGANATSTTALTIGLGSRSLTIQTGKNFAVGHTLKIASTASPANYMVGDVVSYNAGTGALVVDVTFVGGTGSASAWTVTIFSGASSGGAGRNYVFNGDLKIQQEPVPGGVSVFVSDGFFVRNVSGGGQELFIENGIMYVGFIGGLMTGALLGQIETTIDGSDTGLINGLPLIVSCRIKNNLTEASGFSVTLETPATTNNDYMSKTILATNLGFINIAAGATIDFSTSIPAGLNFSRGLRVIFVKHVSNNGIAYRTFGITNVKVGTDSNFESNDADIIRALKRYERSYEDGATNAATSLIGAKRAQVLTGGVNLVDATVVYKQKKRTLPTVTIYSPINGANANVAEYTPAGVFVANRVATVRDSTEHGFNLTITGGTAGNVAVFHWVADSRL
jgi:hypothetical protein